MTELITWSNKFACGIRLIDNQHKELVRLVNDMFNHVSGNDYAEYEYFNKIIQEAVLYIKTHFATEEKIMLATNFEGYADHKRKHDSFVLSVASHINDFRYGRRVTLFSFTKFLKDWVLTHIAVMDKQYFDYLKKIATRKENGKMTISMEDIKRQI